MNPEQESANVQQPVDLSSPDIQAMAKSAAEFVKSHGFGMAFPLVMASAAALADWGQFINCWENCKPPGTG